MAKQDVRVELFHSGLWNPITDRVFVEDGITITRGKGGEGQQLKPATAALTLDNTGGRFSPRNPRSPLFGLIGRNTPIRVSMGEPVSEGFEDSNLNITITDAGDGAWFRSSTRAHTGVFSFAAPVTLADNETADAIIDVPLGVTTLTLWYKVSSEADFDFFRVLVDAVAVLEASGEVDWTFLELDVTGASTVTLRYDKDISLSEGADRAWVDDLTFGDVRFVGEVSSWPPQWNIPGTVVRTPIQAAGITRRIGRAQTTLKSAPERYLARTGPAGFWPLDDPPGSNESRAVVGEPMRPGRAPAPLTRKGFPAYGEGRVAAWLPPGIKGSTETGTIAASLADGTTGGWVVELMYRADQSTTDSFPVGAALVVTTDGFEFRLAWGADDGIFGTIVLDSSGAIVGSGDDPDNSALLDGQPHHIRWIVQDTFGTSALSRLFVDGVEEHAASVDIGVDTIPAHGGLKLAWNGEPAAQAAVSFSMLVFYQFIPPIADALDAAFGHEGERPAARFDRILREEGIPHAIVGNPDDEEIPLGPQFPGKLVELLREIGAAGMGWLYEARNFRGYIYRTVGSGYNQTPALELDYAAGEVAPPLRPTDDDKDTVNDVTAQRRKGGGEVRRVREVGPMNVNDPADDPQGIGRYDTSTTLNVAGVPILANQAGWLLHLGTTDEARYPKITVDLDATPHLADAAAAVDIGDRLTIVNPPDDPDVGLPPETITQLVVGYTEPIGSHRRKITFNCVPESPYHIAEVEHPDFGIIGGGGAAVLGEDLTETETDVGIALGASPDFVHEADFDILVAGERMTVTAVTAATGTFPNRVQFFTVIRSVNGIVKAHPVTPQPSVDVFHKSYIGL